MPNLGNKGERKRATKSRAQKIKSSKKLVEDLEDTEEITTPIENESVEDTKPDKVVVKPFSSSGIST